MNLRLKFLLGAVLATLLAAVAHAQALSTTGISASPASARPGDSVTFTVSVTNSGLNDITAGTADFRIVLTNIVSGASITLVQNGVAPAALISKASINVDGVTIPGYGSFSVTVLLPTQTTEAGDYRATVTMTGASAGGIHEPALGGSTTASVSTSILTVTGKPDFQITSLSYPAGISYVGGDVIPMKLTFRNNITGGDGHYDVPYVPAINGFPAFFRIQVVLSSNPTFGDADDQQLTFFDVSAGTLAAMIGNTGGAERDNAGNIVLKADGLDRTISWNQVLPGNFSGSYYVLAKINMLSAGKVDENDPPVQNINGNNVWSGNSLDPNATLINLLPSNFPTTALASHANNAATSGSGYSDNPSMSTDGRYVAFASDATNLIATDTKRRAEDYRSIFRILGEEGVIAADVAAAMEPAASLRNRLVHAYDQVDDRRVHEMLRSSLSVLRSFGKAVATYLERVDHAPP